MRKVLFLFLSAVLFAACDSGSTADAPEEEVAAVEKPAAPAVPAVVGSWQAIPNLSGFVADVPTGAKPNGAGGAAGFHSDDSSYNFVIRETSTEAATKKLAAVKTEIEEMFFKRWISAAAAADGFVISYEGIKMDMEGNEAPQYSAQVRRKIGDKTFDCSGNVAAEAGLANVIKTCSTIRAN